MGFDYVGTNIVNILYHRPARGVQVAVLDPRQTPVRQKFRLGMHDKHLSSIAAVVTASPPRARDVSTFSYRSGQS